LKKEIQNSSVLEVKAKERAYFSRIPFDPKIYTDANCVGSNAYRKSTFGFQHNRTKVNFKPNSTL